MSGLVASNVGAGEEVGMTNSDRYFALMESIHEAMAAKRYAVVLQHAYESLPLIPGWIGETKREYDSFDITEIPAIELAARFSAAQGDVERLESLRSWVASIPELQPWVSVVDDRIVSAQTYSRIIVLVTEQPGFHQNALPGALDVPGRITSRLVADMDALGVIRREKAGKTYALYAV